MLANLFSINPFQTKRVFFLLTLFCIVTNLYAQKSSVLESITENEGLNTNYVFNVCEDHEGFFWLGTDKGLVKFDEGKWKVFDTDNGLPGNYINRVVADQKEGLYLYLSEKGVFFFNTRKNKITHDYSTSKERYYDITPSTIDPNYIIVFNYTLGNSKAVAIHVDNKTKKIPVYHDKHFYYLIERDKRKNILSTKELVIDPFSSKRGEMEVKLIKNVGIIKLWKGKVVDTLLKKENYDENLIQSVYLSSANDVYVSTLGAGISIIRNRNRKNILPLENQKIRQIQFENNTYYMLSEGHLLVIKNKEIVNKLFLMNDALCFLMDQGNLFVGSFSGFYHYSFDGKNLKKIRHNKHGVGISKIIKDQGKIFYSTYGNGIFDDKLQNVTPQKKYPFDNLENLFVLQDGYAVNSYQSGFYTVDKNFKILHNFTKSNGLLSNYVSYIFPKNEYLYVGTKNGMSIIKNGKIIKNFSKNHGFEGSIVREIFEDQNQQIWVVSDEYIMKFNGNNFTTFGTLKYYGQNRDKITKSFYNKEKNELLIITKNKASIMNLDLLYHGKKPPVPKITMVMSDGKKINFNGKIQLQNQNFSTEIHFQPVYKDPTTEILHYYKINQEDWKLFPQKSVLTLSHLDEGDYKIQIKTVNADGIENLMPKSIHLKVLEKWYKTWWFFISLLLLIIGIIGYLINDYNKKKYIKKLQEIRLKQQLELERKRISRDLHDNIGAYTTSLIAKVDQLKTTEESKEIKEGYDDIRENAQYIMSLLRQTIWVLGNKETDLFSFYDNFKSYSGKYLKLSKKLKIIYLDEIENNRILESTLAINLFRILQEALQNIVKHAQAEHITMKISSSEKIEFCIVDNGSGFNVNDIKSGNGLRNMEERAKEIGYTFILESSLGNGTSIKLIEQ